jgi:hypothetical protein
MDLFLILPLIIGLYLLQRRLLVDSLQFHDPRVTPFYFDILFSMHIFLWIVYLLYSLSNNSDSGEYYRYSVEAETWFELLGTGTTFIRFLAYPFSNLLNLSYYSVMLIFSFMGFQGIVLLYLAARENIGQLPIRYAGLSILEILFLLPNTHFWSSSIGKGSVILLGIGLAVYGISRFNRRFYSILVGAALIFIVRPHVLLALLVGLTVGVLLTNKGIKWFFRIPIILVAIGLIILVSDEVVEFAGIESLNVFESSSIDRRAAELGKGGSGIDITSYSQPMKFFTFMYRPLFIDAPGAMGILTSFENLFILLLSIRMLLVIAPVWNKASGFHKTAIFFLIMAAFTLAQISGNLGIAMRQKAQLMPLFFIFYAVAESHFASQRRLQ